MCKKLSGVNLDCLIHNAGIYEFNSFESLDKKSILRQFEVNALSPIRMTQSLKHFLKRSSKVAFITVEWDLLKIIHLEVLMVTGCLKSLCPWQQNHFL